MTGAFSSLISIPVAMYPRVYTLALKYLCMDYSKAKVYLFEHMDPETRNPKLFWYPFKDPEKKLNGLFTLLGYMAPY